MYALTICFGPVGTSWRLLYKTQESAENAFAKTQPLDKTQQFESIASIDIEDDFGQKANFMRAGIHGRMLENLDESKIGNVEMALHGARTQASAQRQAEADPALRTARMAQSPAMLNPMGNGRWPS